MASHRLHRHLTRRNVLRGAGASLTLAAATPFFRTGAGAATLRQTPTTTDISGTSLNILLWSHFVPRHDVWFDQFVAEWGEANGVTTQVDHVNTADVPAAIAAEIAAGEGHDIVEHIASLAQYEKSVLDMTDVVEELNDRHGEQLPMAMRNSFNPTTNVYYGLCHGYAPDPGNYRRSLWEQVEMAEGPRRGTICWPAARRSSRTRGCQMGLGMSNESRLPHGRADADVGLWRGRSRTQNENVIINSPETVAAVKYMAELFKKTMTPEVFGWNAASNNQLLVAGRASYILNSISAYRTAQKDQPEVGADIFFRTPLLGPAGRGGGAGARPRRLHLHDPQPRAKPGHGQGIPVPPGRQLRRRPASRASSTTSRPGPRPCPSSRNGWLDNDPYGSEPADKLAPAEDGQRLDDQPRSPRSGQRGDGRDLRPANPAEHDGPRRQRPADARGIGRRRPRRRSTRSSTSGGPRGSWAAERSRAGEESRSRADDGR